MSTILLVEDVPDLCLEETRLLESRGHHVLWCSGGPMPFEACPMIRRGSCVLADSVDLIIFNLGQVPLVVHRAYRGEHVLRAYRAHPRYGRLPMVVHSFGVPDGLEGSGPIAVVPRFAPRDVVEAVSELLAQEHATPTTRRPHR